MIINFLGKIIYIMQNSLKTAINAVKSLKTQRFMHKHEIPSVKTMKVILLGFFTIASFRKTHSIESFF